MKPVALVDARTTGGFGDQVETVKMGFDENSIEHLLMLMTDLYSDKVLAVIREYSTNARDAQIEAGIKRPIEVTLPNAMSPFFKVRDFGVGLSADDIANVYSKYGASTKRGSNDFNGMLGIGGKSALTYTTQFTVVSIRDGRKITVIVSRVGSVAQMQIVSNVETTDAPGTEVTVPVKPQDAGAFRDKANYLYSFWDKGQVLVNGAEPARIEVKMVTDIIGTSTDVESDIIVMGGVPYPVGSRLFDNRRYYGAFKVVAFVNIGDVAITPSREALMHDTPATDTTIAVLKEEFTASLRATVQQQIDACATFHKAYAKRVEWMEELSSAMPAGVTYKGAAFPDTLNFNYARWSSNTSRHAFGGGYRSIGADHAMKAVHITGFDAEGLTPRNKEKINSWKNAQGVSASLHIFTPAGLDPDLAKWIDPKRVTTWAAIKAVALPKKAPVARKQPTIDVIDATGSRTQAPIDPLKTPLYVSPTERTSGSAVKTLLSVFPNVQVIEISANRWDKFVRENPKARPLGKFVAEKMGEARKTLTEKDKMTLGMDYWTRDKFKCLDEKKVNDPKIVERIEVAKGVHSSPALTKYNSIRTVASALNIGDERFSEVAALQGYPLMDVGRYGTLDKKHIYIYVNAVYSATQNGEL